MAPKPPKRIHELAKDYKISSNAMMAILKELKLDPKSHMSIATPEMIAGVNIKFAQARLNAKKEMELKQQQQAAKTRTAPPPPPQQQPRQPLPSQIGGITVSRANPQVAGLMQQIDKRNTKKKDRRKQKKERQEVDQTEIQRSFKATMAVMSGTGAIATVKGKRRRRDEEVEDGGGVATDSKTLEVNEFITVAELAGLMDVKPAEVIAKLFSLGAMATINQRLDMDTIETVASEFGFDIKEVADVAETVREEEKTENMQQRAPVVTVMGHVDHGKTSLLDFIRKTNVVAGEAGAITQHIGAYEAMHNDSRIVFLDTPGHEAFTAMRARGTQLTDIVILVVASDEGVRPQTIEAIDHARAGQVPIIAAITKVDKPGANVENVKRQLAELNLMAEDWGGKTITVEVSAKSGLGMSRLLDMILLQAEIMDLKADPSIRAQGVIVDARLERGRGPVATVLVQRGSCAIGDTIVAGVFSGRIRSMTNDCERPIQKIGPSTPAQITGLNGVPQAGDSFMVVKDDQEAREITLKRDQLKREYESRRASAPVTLEKVFDRIQEGHMKEVRLIIKADVDGSAEVLADTLGKISTSEVKTNIIRRGVGGITESDVLLASASDAIIIGFHVAPDARAREIARRDKVDIRQYNIIYEAEDDVRKALEGLLAPTISEQFVGSIEVRETFKVPKIGTIAGCYVKEGRISRKDRVRLLRDGKVVFSGILASLKRFKEDVREVKEGFECGVGIENFNDIKVGDTIEAFELVETARTLDA